jgi:filamentous hemagglutinin
VQGWPGLKRTTTRRRSSWRHGGNDGAARMTSHAAVAGLGAALGGGNVAGALGGTVAGDVAGARVSAAVGSTAGSGTNDTLSGTLISNVASGLAGAVAGGVLGGTSGATSGAGGALNADLYNRQLHADEMAAIRAKARSDATEEKRLTAAACYVVRCWAEFSPNSSEWLANYVSPEEAKELGQELQWVSGQKAQSGLFVYTLPQRGKDLSLNQVDQFRRGVEQFGRDVKNLPRDIANTRVGMPGDVQQGDAGPQTDITGGGNDRMPPTATAVVTPSVMLCGPGVLCRTIGVSPVVTSGAPMLSSSGEDHESSDGTRASGSAISSSSQPTHAASELTFGDNGRKLDFLFNQNIDLSNTYNAARAAGNASRIGIADTPANRAEVARLFNKAHSDPTSIVGPGTTPGSNLREFYLPGSTGTGSKIQFVELNGKVLTIIAK